MVSGAIHSKLRVAKGSTRPDRLLGLEIRPKRTGFVVLERNTQLVDWGTRMFRAATIRDEALRRKLSGLLEFYAPTAIVVRHRSGLAAAPAARVRDIIHEIKLEARRRSITFRHITANQVHQFFEQHGCRTKYETARLLAQRFEGLTSKLPPKRKPWQSEHPSMVVFDALAAAVTQCGTE